MTSSIKWEPIEDLKAIRDLISRTLIRPWIDLPVATVRHMQVLGVRNPIDIYETEGEWIAEAEAPGLRSEDLHVSVTGHKLTIRVEPAAIGRAYVYRERSARPFSRTILVPSAVNVDAISATLKNGVLTLRMPKRTEAPEEEAQPAPVGE